MSSNIRIERICEHCDNSFVAKTTVTRYCGDRCAKAAYKNRKRNERIKQSSEEIEQKKAEKMEALKANEFLTVPEVAVLLRCSKRTTYRLINNGVIKAMNIAERKTLVKRSDIDKMFE
ncbi:MAG: helix-turn-helix domain-containing protein [Bacteroidetes bacterium]|nr:helix-turn-helix domain-containing protein [Bacteroidota bacterium]